MKEIDFLDKNLQADSSIKYTSTYFLTAEFGMIAQDTAKYFSHYTLEPKGNWHLKIVRNYHGGPKMEFKALLIKSDIFIQLRRSFPYYSRTFDTFHPQIVVKRMNRKLHRFYRKRKSTT